MDNVVKVEQLTKLQKLKKNYQLNKPKYLQGAGYVGIGLTAASGVFTGMKMPKAISKAKKEIKKEDKWFKKWWKYFKHVAPITAPTLICAAGTGLSFHGAYKEQGRRLAVVGAAYAGAMTELQTLKKKAEEVGGKKVADKIKQACKDEKVADKEFPEDKEKLEKQRTTSPDSVLYSGGELPHYDPMLQKIHWCTPDTFVKIQSKMMSLLERDGYVDMTTLYEELGYGYNTSKPMPKFASDYGWTASTPGDYERYRNQLPDSFFDVNSTAITKDGIPCKFIDFYDMHMLWEEIPFK